MAARRCTPGNIDEGDKLWQTEAMPARIEAPPTIRARKAVMWTREDCRKIEAMGLLPDKWELVQGEIISRMGSDLPHGRTAASIAAWLFGAFPVHKVSLGSSIDVAPEDNPASEPVPDITVLNRVAGELDGSPQPADIALLVEVSDATLVFDLGPKAALYARAGIPEYWVLDIHACVIHQHREPSPEGYRTLRTVSSAGVLSPLANPEARLTPAEIFG